MTEPDFPPSSVLDEYVCFALYDASHAVTQAYRGALEPWSLTYPQYLVFVTLWAEGPLSLGELGQRLGLDSGTLSPLTRRLEAVGYLERSRHAEDARVVTISLTASGEAMRETLAEVPGCIARAMNIDQSSARQLISALRTLATDTREQTAGIR